MIVYRISVFIDKYKLIEPHILCRILNRAYKCHVKDMVLSRKVQFKFELLEWICSSVMESVVICCLCFLIKAQQGCNLDNPGLLICKQFSATSLQNIITPYDPYSYYYLHICFAFILLFCFICGVYPLKTFSCMFLTQK